MDAPGESHIKERENRDNDTKDMLDEGVGLGARLSGR